MVTTLSATIKESVQAECPLASSGCKEIDEDIGVNERKM